MKFLLLVFFALFPWIVFAGTSAAKPELPRGQARALPFSVPKEGLNFSIGRRGIESLSFNGQSLLASPESGELQPQKSVFRAVLEALFPRSSSPIATPN